MSLRGALAIVVVASAVGCSPPAAGPTPGPAGLPSRAPASQRGEAPPPRQTPIVPGRGPNAAHAEPPAGARVFRHWYPGYLPGSFGRTTVVLEEIGPGARLTVTLERPADGRRRNPNPAAWTKVPSLFLRLEGRAQARPDGVTYWFDTAAPRPVALVCRPVAVEVHAAGATVDPPACSPCYDPCPDARPRWTPAVTRPRAVLDCVLRSAADVARDGRENPGARSVPDLAGLGRERIAASDSMNPTLDGHLFFAPSPGVELLVGTTDCPPQGLREVR